MTTRTGYSRIQIGLHWAVALLIGVNYFVSDGMEAIFDGSLEGKAVTGWTPAIHVYVGVTILALVLLRLAVRMTQGAPEHVASRFPLMDRLGDLSHWLLYGLMLLVPALGAISWFGAVDATAGLHVLAMNAMMILILVHAAAAMLHQFVLRDGLLMRMVRGQ